MTRDEAKQLIIVITYAYPNFKPLDLSKMVDIWARMLRDYDYHECDLALQSYITSDTSGFAPSIGQLIDKLDTIKNYGTELNEMEAWSMVSKALRNGTYHSQEEFEKLPDQVKVAVGSADQLRHWAMSDAQSVETVIQSNFIKTFRATQGRCKEIRKMPLKVQQLIADTSSKMIGVEG